MASNSFILELDASLELLILPFLPPEYCNHAGTNDLTGRMLVKPSALCRLGKCFTTELYYISIPPPLKLFLSGICHSNQRKANLKTLQVRTIRLRKEAISPSSIKLSSRIENTFFVKTNKQNSHK